MLNTESFADYLYYSNFVLVVLIRNVFRERAALDLVDSSSKMGVFWNMMGCKNIGHNIGGEKSAGNTVHCRVSVVYPRDHVADGELQVFATAQPHVSSMLHINSPDKIKIHHVKYIPTECTSLLHHHQVQKLL